MTARPNLSSMRFEALNRPALLYFDNRHNLYLRLAEQIWNPDRLMEEAKA